MCSHNLFEVSKNNTEVMYPSQEVHLITSGNVDHWVKMVSARFIHGKAASFLFPINKSLEGRYFDTMQISVSPQTFTH